MRDRIKICIASEAIAWGSVVLVRGLRCSEAGEEIANARLRKRNPFDDEDVCRPGQSVSVEMIADLGSRSLQALANGPCMNALEIYLPAGKLSMAETIRREQEALRNANSQP